MPTIKRVSKIKNTESKIWKSYFKAAKEDTLQLQECATKDYSSRNFQTFTLGSKTYAVTSFDHFNGHMSNVTNEAAIYAIYVALI